MQYKILATDIDNTLVMFGEKSPRTNVVNAIAKMQEKGVKLVLSTGRSLFTMSHAKLLKGVNFDYAVCSSGSQIVDSKSEIIFEETLDTTEMYALVDFCEDFDYCLHFSFEDGYYAYVNYQLLSKIYAEFEGTGLSIQDGENQDRHLQSMPVAAFAVLPTQDGLTRFNEKYGHLGLNFMQIGMTPDGKWTLYDIVRGHLDKATGLAHICEKLGCDMTEVVAIGDSGNDRGMLKAAGLGVAMGNADEATKAVADMVVATVQEDGLAQMIEKVWF